MEFYDFCPISAKRLHCGSKLDTGHFFPCKPAPMPIFLAQLKVNNSKLELFYGLRNFRGSQKQERKNDYNSTILGTRNEVRSKFDMRKTNGLFFVQ